MLRAMSKAIDQADSMASPAGGVTRLERRLLEGLLEATGRPPLRIVLWNGEAITSGDGPPVATMSIRDRGALLRMLTNPELHPADDYADGRIEIEGDLVAMLCEIFRGLDTLPEKSARARFLRWINRPGSNTPSVSKENVRRHYDLGNDFYRLWLDAPLMQYTCAYFPREGMTLEQAQAAKLDHVARKLQLRPGQLVFEAGCGWGGLARHFARNYGVRVRAYNLSEEQVAFAREQAQREGLDGRVEYVLDDYRNMQGSCDVFVSVGMLEHVGLDHYPALGDVIHRVLKPEGRGIIHSIGRNKPAPMNAWTEKRIFPGAYPPTLGEMMRVLEGHGFSVLDVENLRLHYARTLAEWLGRYEAHADTVRTMYDERFVKTWRMYLAASRASFLIGALQLFQVVFARPQDNSIPMSRESLYRP
jgi:cyclopropane-fatty-acyl-phospholipid synthase